MNFQLAKYSLLKKFSENIGFTTPEEYGAIFKYLIENVKTDRQIIYSPHCHDDLGIAVANSLAAVLMRQGKVPLKQSLTLSISSLINLFVWCPTLSMQ